MKSAINATILFILLGLALSCGRRVIHVPVPGPTVIVTEYINVPAVPTPELEELVAEENEYRNLLGQSPLASGLACSLYNLAPSPTPAGPPAWFTPSDFPATLPTAVAKYAYVGDFNQPNRDSSAGINVLPPAFQSTYKQWYALRCTGYLAITDSEYYEFDLTSDDASKLYLDGKILVDNGGNHSMQLRTGAKLLKRGIHSFKIDYMSGPGGGQGLIIEMNGSVIPSELFYR